jgi:hypothetical protein
MRERTELEKKRKMEEEKMKMREEVRGVGITFIFPPPSNYLANKRVLNFIKALALFNVDVSPERRNKIPSLHS